MRTFKLEIALDIKANVPQSVTDSWRADAVSEEATPFLKAAHEMFAQDDEGFTLHILKHGCRGMVRSSLRGLLESSGIGGTLSPAKASIIDTSADLNAVEAQPVLATQIEAALDGTLPTEQLG